MRRGSALRVIRMIRPDPATMSVLFLSVCFLIGGLIGDLYAKSSDVSLQAAFRQYLSDYFFWFERSGASVPIGRCILLYFTPVCVAFLFGFSPFGMIAVPICSAGLGFLSFFTVSCFVQSFGKDGVLLAASLTALRLLFTLPCYLVIASKAMILSTHLLSLSVGRGKRVQPLSDCGRYIIIWAICLCCLCIGILCERTLTPIFFRTVIGGVAPFS